MNFKSMNFKKYYYSDSDDILQDFYIPTLQNSIQYDRLAGFFSSTALAIASKGLLGLIENTGKMRLIISPKLEKDDIEIIIHSYKSPEKFIEKKLIEVLEEMEMIEEKKIKEHVYMLGWMLANKKLEIRLALAIDENNRLLNNVDIVQQGLFHQKVGILKDNAGNIISFSGSINETSSGWLKNIEEFKVFRSWNNVEKEYIDADIEKFNCYWNGNSRRIKIIEIPEAVKMKLIQVAPKNINELSLRDWYERKTEKKITLFDHQKKAIESWFDNNCKGIFEMATGTGKTFTALGCLRKILLKKENIIIVITTPYQHLSQQWKNEMITFGLKLEKIIIADSSNHLWKKEFADSVIDLSLNYIKKIIVLTTHTTFSSKSFSEIINKVDISSFLFLIADEVHGLGAKKASTGLVEKYNYRLGLSATPKRYFDKKGTQKLYDYFGGVIFSFPLDKAINTFNPMTGNTFLVPYKYNIRFVNLYGEEIDEYSELTQKIFAIIRNDKNTNTKDDLLERLLFKRADIIKNAKNKYKALSEIIEEIISDLYWTIIYCSPKQIHQIMRILNQYKILAHMFTMSEGTKERSEFNGFSERNYLLKEFSKKKYQVLVAMKCLDEGMDIPPARKAIFMSSSGNHREYFQRIGRVLRTYPQKNMAELFDIIVVPTINNFSEDSKKIEKEIFKKELKRYTEIAKNAINRAEVLEKIYEIEENIRRI